MSVDHAPSRSAAQRRTIEELVDELAHLLPEQTPLESFVHHNTLHAFEQLPFDEAVVAGARLYGTEPYMTEAAFQAHLSSGRILSEDIEAVVAEELPADGAPIFPGAPDRARFRAARLRHLFEVPRGAALEWELLEGLTLARFHEVVDVGRATALLRTAERIHGPLGERELTRRTLRKLWEDLERVAPKASVTPVGPRRRDQLLAAARVDTDQRVHPLLIRLCAAFLDQGVAYWPMPEREHGFLSAVRRLYGRRCPSPSPWLRGLAAEWRRQEREGWDAARTVEWALGALETPDAAREAVVRETLLSLKGWAGMMRQFELRPDRAPVAPQPARLLEHLAVQLTLDLFAARHGLRLLGSRADDFRGLEAAVPALAPRVDRELVHEAFVLAQALGVDVAELGDPTNARAWLAEVADCDEFERRRLLHLAYERRHRIGVLDGLVAHCRLAAERPPEPRFQALFCIDDRECSTRRLLEESSPDVETFGYAGFFGVAMAYKGLDDVRARPLCPVNVVPAHRVEERALRPDEEAAWLAARRRLGSVAHSLRVGSRTIALGGLLSAPLGLAAMVALIGRCLAPRTTERLAHRFHRAAHSPPPTRLALLRRSDERDEEGRQLGYSVEEMANVVEACLRTTALDRRLTRLVLVVGHGSSSLNNPHESAHDCGATGGGRGGPNARAFAAMANRPEVRALLRVRGISLPDTIWFVGAYHNTCDDGMTYYDEDLVPDELAEEYARVKESLRVACELDAHERCRRFESAPKRLRVDDALAHAEAHAVDLAQPRPEYGHATNAVAVVGRRSRTRGLFLDRRAFLVSYDSTTDEEGVLLEQLLAAVVPVGAGINLEYYFSFVDPTGYGSGTKLPHNVVGLIGVMDGHASDLRTGLPWQMVEIHEPVRLLTIVEVRREVLERILAKHPDLADFVRNGWIQLVRWEPDTDDLEVFTRDGFRPYEPESPHIPVVQYSSEYYAGHSEHLGLARVEAAFGAGASR